MNATVITPEVQDFLSAVRAELADLDPEEQREILDGLEADLGDLVAEQGEGALGDPVAYARELRTAAGLEPESGQATRPRTTVPMAVHAFLDDVHRLWDRLVHALPGDSEEVLNALRPAWWVLRAWLAVELAALTLGEWALQVVPGQNLVGGLALVVAVVLSVQLGRGRLWPGDAWRRNALLRVVLLGLNGLALVAIPLVLDGLDHAHTDRYSQGFSQGYRTGQQDLRAANGPKAGLYADGKWVSNVFPYDASGRPLVGVQLFNQIGQPINVITRPDYDDQGGTQPRVFYPWTNGATQLGNVFPIPSRLQADENQSPTAFTDAVRPTIGALPLTSVPRVSLPGIEASRQRPATR